MTDRQSVETGIAIGLGVIGIPEVVAPTTSLNIILGLVACAGALKLAYHARQNPQPTLPIE